MKILLSLGLIISLYSVGAQIDLQYNLKKGQSFRILSTAEQNIKQEMMGQQVDMTQTYTQGVQYDIQGVFGDMTRIKCTYYRMAFEISSMAMTMSYDSDNPAPSSDNPLAMTFGSMVDKSFLIQINSAGEISSVDGMESIIEGIIENTVGDDATKAQLEMQLQTQFGQDAIAKSMEQGFKLFPPRGKAEKNESWSFQHNLGIYDLDIENSYELSSFDNNSATISMSSTIDPSSFTQNMNGQEMEMEMSGTQTGTITVERSSGMILNGTINQDLSATASVMGMSIPMEITSTNTFQRED